MYRTMQMVAITMNHIFEGWITIAYFGVVLLLISSSFVIIQLRLELGIILIILLVTVNVALTIISAVIIQSALNFSTYSGNYIRIAKNVARSKMETTFLKSCQPICISVGGFFTLSNRNFCLHTYLRVVLETTINLLLTLKNSKG